MSRAMGGCLCGEVRYECAVDPAPRVTICHCTFCQRATGSPYLVLSIFEKEHFWLNTGTPRVYSSISEGSGKNIWINFCEICGTKLFLKLERNPSVVGVYSGTFDDPDWFDRSPDRTKIIFTDCAQTGSVIPAGYPTFSQHAQTKQGERIEPLVLDRPRWV